MLKFLKLNATNCYKAFFSTTFFSFSSADDQQQGQWVMSNEVWVYWVTTIGLTLLLGTAWYIWQKMRKERIQPLPKWAEDF
jgi:hypothetical protein